MLRVFLEGNFNRNVGSINMNELASCSHSIFTITVESTEMVDHVKCVKVAKLNIVDLASSERQSKIGLTSKSLEEFSKINLSLSTLCHVI